MKAIKKIVKLCKDLLGLCGVKLGVSDKDTQTIPTGKGKPKLYYRVNDVLSCISCGRDLYTFTTTVYCGDYMKASQLKGIDCDDPKQGDLTKCPYCGAWII